MKKYWDEPIVKFLAVGLVLYLGWLALYEWWIHPAGWADNAVINNTISISTAILEFLGYEVEHNGNRMLGIKGTPGLFIGDSCNGISLFALYSIFILAFPGKIVPKLIFISVGILVIHLLNVIRVMALSIILTYSYEWTEFNHTYTFTTLIYAFIFLTWLFWVNTYSLVYEKKVKTEDKN
jgi:exosortase family protein XrtF